MFDWLRELGDTIKAEFDLATANPSPELCASVKRAMDNNDGMLCSEFEDSETWMVHGRILGDMEEKNLTINDPAEIIAKATGWDIDQVIKTIEAQKIVIFLRKKLYEDKQIKRIGSIAMSLQKHDGDVSEVSAETGADEESVAAVIHLIDEYANSIGGKVEWPNAVSADSNASNTSSKTQSASKKNSSKTTKKDMIKPISIPETATAK